MIITVHRGIKTPHKIHHLFAKQVSDLFISRGYSIPYLIYTAIRISFKGFDRKPRIVFCTDFTSVVVGLMLKLRYRSKIVLLYADTIYYLASKGNLLYSIVASVLSPLIDKVITVSENNKKILKRWFDGEDIYVVETFVPEKRRCKSDIFSYNICMISSSWKEKGYAELVEAIKIVSRTIPNIKLFLIGDAAYHVKFNYPWLIKIGRVKDVYRILSKCSIYVHPAKFDSCPVSVFEAMKCGLIVIITTGVGQHTILESNDLEFLVMPSNDPVVISSYIKKILSLSKKEKRELSRKLKQLSRNYDIKKQLRKFKKTFNTIEYKLLYEKK